MNCCEPETTCGKSEASERVNVEVCVNCGSKGIPVSRKTVLLMLKSELLDYALTGSFRFCENSDCSIVYFQEAQSRVFSCDDLRMTVGVKSNKDPIPICYCFGFEVSHLREEISKTGSTTIPAKISSLIREGFCACESRNPSGKCCLGEVNRTVKELQLVVVRGTSSQ